MRIIEFFLIALLFLLAAGCVSNTVQELPATSITEYQGQKLSSIDDFRDNSIKGTQHVNLTTYRLEITGLVKNPQSYTYSQALDHQKYSKVVTLHCVEGWDATIYWEGVLVKDLLKEASPLPEANTVIFYAVDGYSTSFPLSYFSGKNIILAYNMNNATLIPRRGYPFQLVAEDKWGYKWIKWITKIELSANKNYEGYWESRGYADSGNLTEGYLK